MKSKTKSKNKKSADWQYFDDCLICKAMQTADEQGRSLSGKELRDVFDKANEQQKKTQ